MTGILQGKKLKSIGIWTLVAVLLLSACDQLPQGTPRTPAEVQTETRSVGIEGADAARVEINLGAGQLRVSGGAAGLMDADFTYNVAEWEPEVNYEVNNNQGRLTIQQPAQINIDTNLTNFRYEWDVRLNSATPIDLDVNLGAGESILDLTQVNLTGLDVSMGAGRTTIDLSGNYSQGFVANIQGGVGNLTLRLPSEQGVQVSVTGVLGNIIATGLSRDGDVFINETFGTSPTSLIVNVSGGIGEVNLEVVD